VAVLTATIARIASTVPDYPGKRTIATTNLWKKIMNKKTKALDCETITVADFLAEMGRAMGLSPQQIQEFVRDMTATDGDKNE
jgi:DNA replication protein DnaD